MKRIALFLLVALSIVSCRQSLIEKSKKEYEKFNNYITSYSQSPISRCSDVRISLNFNVDNTQPLPVNLLEIKPAVGGHYVVGQNKRSIILKNADFKHNVAYTVKFNIGKLTEMPSGMQSFTFPLEVKKQTWDILMDPPLNTSMEYVTYSGKIKYTDCEPNKIILEESLSALQNKNDLQIIWDHDKKHTRQSKFTILNVKRADEPEEIALELSMAALNVNDKARMTLAVPSKSDFSFHTYKILNNQHIQLTFTDPLIESQDLTGIISISDRPINQIKIYKNQVDIFLADDNYGKFQLNIRPGIKNLANFPLKDSYEEALFFAPPNPRVSIAEKGNILPPDNRWEIPVTLVTATGFRLRILKIYEHNISRFYQENSKPYQEQHGLENIGRIVVDTIFSFNKKDLFHPSFHSVVLDDIIRKEKGALYKLVLTIPNEQNAYPCDKMEGSETRDMLETIDFDRPWINFSYSYNYYDDGYYYNDYGRRGGTKNYNDQALNYDPSPCYKSHETVFQDARLVMCSDIGLVVKSEPQKDRYFGYISRISSANPLSGAKLELFDVQGKNINTAFSDDRGMLSISVKGEVPFLAKASYSGQYTYLPLFDADALSLSTFQVDGKIWNGKNKVYFYGDRDVWRPGDSIYMQSIVFSPNKKLPAKLPIQLKLYDPTNKLVKNWTVFENQNGLYDCRFGTDINDPTGYWRLEVELAGESYYNTIRVETIRPNRLKMSMAFAQSEQISSTDVKEAPLQVKWMHGLVAKSLNTEIYMYQRSVKNPFGEDYQNYVFDDIRKNYQIDLGLVQSGITNDEGILPYSISTADDTSYPSMMLFNFELRSFEKGGAFSTDMKAIKYSPYDHYIGAKFPGGDNGHELYIKSDEAILLTALSQNGQAVSREVSVSLQEIHHNWWYQYGNRGNYAALKNSIHEVKKNYVTTVGKAGKSISIDLKGRYLLTIEDIQSGHSISRVIYSYDDYWMSESEEVSQLEVLPFLIEKSKYQVGESLSFDLPPASSGQFLITVESGGEIVYKSTSRASKTPSQINLPITSKMTPTAYVHVHLIQAWDTHLNDRPLRLFGVKPITVYDPATVLNPRIAMPDELKTDENFVVEVSEETGKPMTYTLAIVDEGLLDITQFRTPNPWSAFFTKENLTVKTWDMYRDIFHRFLGEYTSLLAVGGDGSNAISPTSKARRFKPVVKFEGPFTLSPGQSKKHNLTINEYVGSVRTMVIATNGKAFGHNQKTTEVKKPLMLYATLPRVLGPEERLKLPITVFSMDKSIKSVQAKVKTNGLVNILGEKEKSLFFEKEGEQDLYFEIETPAKIGLAEVEVSVQSGKHEYTEKITLDVRPSSPRISKNFYQLVEAGKNQPLAYEPIGMLGTQSGNVSLSKGLNFSFAPEVEWLSRYPHGCLEQTISSIFPQIYLYKMGLLDDIDKMKYRQQFDAAIQKLRYLQLPEGGFSYWPGGNTANKWGTSYALQFLLEAQKQGYQVPENMIKKCVSYQYKTAGSGLITSNNNNRSPSMYSTIGQAYKLYTLALAGKPNYAAMNRLRLVPNLHNTAKWMLAHAFLTLGEEKLAESMIKSASTKSDDYRELGGNFGSSIRDQAIIARILIAQGDKIKAKQVIDELVKSFSNKQRYYLSTQDRAQCLITFAQFVSSLENMEKSVPYSLQISQGNTISDTLETTPMIYNMTEEQIAKNELSLTNTGASPIYTIVSQSGQPMRDESKAEAENLKIVVNYLNEDGQKIKAVDLAKGTDFMVEYTITHPGVRGNYENLALSAIFPSGWEIINHRLSGNSFFDSGDVADYQNIRDDRVYLYFDLAKGAKKTFRFKLNATYEGKYWHPPVFCEAMYDASVRAKTDGSWVEIK